MRSKNLSKLFYFFTYFLSLVVFTEVTNNKNLGYCFTQAVPMPQAQGIDTHVNLQRKNIPKSISIDEHVIAFLQKNKKLIISEIMIPKLILPTAITSLTAIAPSLMHYFIYGPQMISGIIPYVQTGFICLISYLCVRKIIETIMSYHADDESMEHTLSIGQIAQKSASEFMESALNCKDYYYKIIFFYATQFATGSAIKKYGALLPSLLNRQATLPSYY